MRIACLQWYELPETQAAQDSFWSVLAQHFRRQGVREVPRHLMRGLSVSDMLTDPRLLLGQCCGYDVVYGFASSVELVATPRYAAPGCDGANYRSFALVRHDCPAENLEGLRGENPAHRRLFQLCHGEDQRDNGAAAGLCWVR